MHRVFEGARRPWPRVLGPVERLLLRLCGVEAKRARAGRSTRSPCWSSASSACWSPTPSAPAARAAAEPAAPRRGVAHSSFNTAVSFTTNTNWQGYRGESTMSYLTQMAGLAWHNFISAGAGICVALVSRAGADRRRDDRRRRTSVTSSSISSRSIVYVLLPISVVVRLWCSPPTASSRTSRPTSRLTTLEGGEADAGDGAGGVAGGHQGARHQRRRLLQRQQRPPVREPDAAHQLPRAAARSSRFRPR